MKRLFSASASWFDVTPTADTVPYLAHDLVSISAETHRSLQGRVSFSREEESSLQRDKTCNSSSPGFTETQSEGLQMRKCALRALARGNRFVTGSVSVRPRAPITGRATASSPPCSADGPPAAREAAAGLSSGRPAPPGSRHRPQAPLFCCRSVASQRKSPLTILRTTTPDSVRSPASRPSPPPPPAYMASISA